jgi:hypothetical protein
MWAKLRRGVKKEVKGESKVRTVHSKASGNIPWILSEVKAEENFE